MKRTSLLRLPSDAVVSFYLGGTLLALTAAKKVHLPILMLAKLMIYQMLPRYRGSILEIRREEGFCYTGKVPIELVSDREGWSRAIILEDGTPLKEGHCYREQIRKVGQGRYCHSPGVVYFSSSDNSDPTQNERIYTIEER